MDTSALMDTSTLANRVYEILKQKILQREFIPGQRLNLSNVAGDLHVSNTPVREAISRLEKVGLVEVVPYRGPFVKALSSKEVAEVYDVRMALEELAVRLAAKRITPDALEKIDREVQKYAQAFDDDDIARGLEIDRRFHDLIAQACGNSILLELLRILTDRIQVLRQLDYGKMRRQASLEDHKLILQALREADMEKAAEATRQHLTKGKEHVLRLFRAAEERRSMPELLGFPPASS